MPAKKGFQRLTIDITKEQHRRLKIISLLTGESMHSAIVRCIHVMICGYKNGGFMKKGMEIYAKECKANEIREANKTPAKT